MSGRHSSLYDTGHRERIPSDATHGIANGIAISLVFWSVVIVAKLLAMALLS